MYHVGKLTETHSVTTLFKKDRKQRTPEQDEKLIAELEKMVDEYEAQIEEKSKEK